MPPRDPADDNEIENLIDEDVEVTSQEDEQDRVDDGDEGQGSGDAGSGQDEEENAPGDVARQDRRQATQPRESSAVRSQRLAREARADADAAKREVAEMRAEMQRMRQPPAETPDQRNARYALMDPEQRNDARLNDALESQNRQFARMQSQMADQSDKAAFASLSATNSFYKRVAAEVETKLAEVRRLGQNVTREALAKYVIGEMVLARGPKATERQRDVGARNIQRQTTRPATGRSDQGSDRGDERRTAARRRALEDVVF